VKKRTWQNASAIYNLLRNLGGSFGVAFVTTMLSPGRNCMRSVLLSISPPLTGIIRWQRIRPDRCFNTVSCSLYGRPGRSWQDLWRLLKQSSMMAFNDAFYLLSILHDLYSAAGFPDEKGKDRSAGRNALNKTLLKTLCGLSQNLLRIW